MQTTFTMTYDQMETRYGDIMAYSMLEQMERAAGLSPHSMTGIAPEIRLANAARVQDAAHFANNVRANVLRCVNDIRVAA